jgi:D-beta-D-heptose 7-phosphate kinase/D-beta-D-heptose 1-phosphate adenosyltransferase
MLDRYIYGAVERISPEAPVPVVRVVRESRMPGGAGNVAANLRAMGARVTVAGFVGEDEAGGELMGLLRAMDADPTPVRRLRNTPTTVKMRVVAERQQVVRVDSDGGPVLSDGDWERFSSRIAEACARADGVILADYGKGALDQRVADAVLEAAGAAGIPSGLDPRNPALRVPGITVVTPNRKEAFQIARLPDPGPAPWPLEDAPLRAAARRLLRHWVPRHLLITLGPQGMLIAGSSRRPVHVPTRAREVFDVSGAGDTVIAVCILALAAGAEIVEAAEIANYAAGVVVGKMGTATCTPDELLAAVAEDRS